MLNKIVRVQNGNPCYLSFGINKKIELIGTDYSYSCRGIQTGDEQQYGTTHIAVILHNALANINLVEEVSVRPYECTVKFGEAFENDTEERTRIMDEATKIINTILYGDSEETVITDKDNREKHRDSSNHFED